LEKISELKYKQEERRQLFEEANRLSLLSKSQVYQDKKTSVLMKQLVPGMQTIFTGTMKMQ